MERRAFLDGIEACFKRAPVVAILGPRQCGKTTLARQFVAQHGEIPAQNHFDLEDPISFERLREPRLALGGLSGLVVIDEIQLRPDLFPLLRVLADRPNRPARFLILGRASPELLRQGLETLAGRIAFLELHPFSIAEGLDIDQSRLFLRGGFPRSYLADSDEDSYRWRSDYARTFLERDLASLGFSIPSPTMRRFWSMLAHYHGQVVNFSDIGRSFGMADSTMRRYIDILEGAFMVRTLQPWHENVAKRQVRRPKLYFRDCGLMHHLLGIETWSDLQLSPRLGASWEGFALEELIRTFDSTWTPYFWQVHQQESIDLVMVRGSRKLAFEFKYAGAPRLGRGFFTAMEILQAERSVIVVPSSPTYSKGERITVADLPEAIRIARESR